MKHAEETKPLRRFSLQSLFLAAVILFGLGLGGAIAYVEWGQSFATRFNGAPAYDYLKQLCDIGPRRSGSAAMAKQQKLLVEHFEKLGGKVELQRFTRPRSAGRLGVPMANIIVRWNPEKPASGSCSAAITTRCPFRCGIRRIRGGGSSGPTTTPAAWRSSWNWPTT